MTTLIEHRADPLFKYPSGSVPTRRWSWTRSRGNSAEEAYLAVVLTSVADCSEPEVAKLTAELKLVECSRALPLAWPLPEWLDAYRVLLATALAERKTIFRSRSWSAAIMAFLQLMFAGRDKSAAELIRALSLHPLAEETRRLRRVQALFAALRPARTLANGFGFTIVTPSQAEGVAGLRMT
jgi:hypothetical protein